MIKLKNILLEIGEGSAKPYSISKSHSKRLVYGINAINFDYRWKTKSGYEYSLDITATPPDLVDPYDGIQEEDMGGYTISFGPMEMGDQFYGIDGQPIGTPQKKMDTQIQTNRGELFSIMATIVKAFKEFMKEAKRTDWGLKQAYFEPSKTQGDAKSDKQRRKLYLAYIRKNLKGVKIRNFQEGVMIEF